MVAATGTAEASTSMFANYKRYNSSTNSADKEEVDRRDKVLQTLFQQWDLNGNGLLEFSELSEVLCYPYPSPTLQPLRPAPM